MVFLIFTRTGFDEILPCIASQLPSVWVGSNVLNDEELNEFRARGMDITSFVYSISPEDHEQITIALATIYEHHPDETVWVEKRQQI